MTKHRDDDDPDTNSPEDLGYRTPPPAVMPRAGKKPAAPPARDEGIRNFGAILGQIADGDLHDELGEQFHEIVRELKHHVEHFGRDAKGTLTLKLAVHARGDGSVMVSGDVAIKKPSRKRGGSTFFLTPGANLTLENPKQQKLPLREVPPAPRQVRELDVERPIRTT